MTSIASIVLILVFVAREALPIFFSEAVRAEVTPGSMIAPITLGDGSVYFDAVIGQTVTRNGAAMGIAPAAK